MWSLNTAITLFLITLPAHSSQENDFVLSSKRSPFCEKQICKCENQTATNPDVNCAGSLVLPNVFLEEMWSETTEDNRTLYYGVNSLNLARSDTGDLKEKFLRSNLRKLDLSENRIRTIADSAFENLQNMTELVLSRNLLEDIQPNAFRGLYAPGYDVPLASLKILRLDRNKIHTLDSDVFQHVERQLEELYLNDNPLKTIDQATLIAITGIQTLKVLDLSRTGISTLPGNFLHTPKYLLKLDLTGNEFTAIPETLNDAHVLEELVLDENPIEELTEKNAFPVAPTVKVLHLCKMPNLTYIGSKSLSGLENLEELYATENGKLVRIDHDALVRMNVETYVWPPIRTLDLNGNHLTHLNYTFLGKWENLKSLNLLNNPWTCECENQWMLDELMPIYSSLDPNAINSLFCGAPAELEGVAFVTLYEKKSRLRCLDLYGNRPEKDGTMLIGMLIGVLLGIPCILFVLYAYQRNWFGWFDSSPAAYSRRFYRAPSTHEDF